MTADDRLARIERDIRLLTWMVGFNLWLTVVLFGVVLRRLH